MSDMNQEIIELLAKENHLTVDQVKNNPVLMKQASIIDSIEKDFLNGSPSSDMQPIGIINDTKK